MPSIDRTPVRRIVTAVALCAVFEAAGAGAQVTLPDGFSHQVVVPGFALPTALAFLPDGRLLVTEQLTGKVRMVAGDSLAGEVGTVTLLTTAFERGLLGLAVDPGWPTRPYLYILQTSSSPVASRISRFTVTGDLDFTGNGQIAFVASSRYDLIHDIPDAAAIHNGGSVRFGPDGRLYVSLGEDNNRCAAQDTVTLGGVILRLDVTDLPAGPGGPPARSLITPSDNPFVAAANTNRRLIWVLGLRNPFSFHIDPADGTLFIADVGASTYEEVDRAPVGGLNFGWPLMEGPLAIANSCPPNGSTLTAPIYYDRSSGSAAIIGAGVYRAPAGAMLPFPAEYEGDYFFSDYYDGQLRRLSGTGNVWAFADTVAGQPRPSVWGQGFGFVSDYAIGPDGSLWLCRQTNGSGGLGAIERIVAMPGARRPPSFSASFGPPVPTPAAGNVRFDYVLSGQAQVTLSIYDLNGRLIRHLVEATLGDPGPHAEVWDGADDDGRVVRSGLYVARLDAGPRRLARRVVIVR